MLLYNRLLACSRYLQAGRLYYNFSADKMFMSPIDALPVLGATAAEVCARSEIGLGRVRLNIT